MQNLILENDFWKANSILIRNFHTLKKFGSLKIVTCYEVKGNFNKAAKFSDVNEFLEFINTSKDFTEISDSNISNLVLLSENYCKLLLFVKELKNSCNARYAFLLLDFSDKTVNFTYIGGTRDWNIFIALKGGSIIVELLYTTNEAHQKWCQYVLQPKLTIWAKKAEIVSSKIHTLSLVDIENYNLLYGYLKKKYAKALTKVWIECTDPSKYIHEDIAIAAYLILIWRQLCKPKGFVDLGCGNGLLVYILNSEGFSGYGIDIRRRKIWDTYPSYVTLIEDVIVPSELREYENIDWLIGNHSDELSCWIPIMAAINSYDTNFFLLPCCAYELNGHKYQRRDCKNSVYNDFLQYVEKIATRCGFIPKIDRLRIPSTKRIAYLAFERNYNEEKFITKKLEVRLMVKAEVENKPLKLREKNQTVRNCTQIKKTVLENIVLKICKYLLLVKDVQKNKTSWERGQTVSIAAIAEYLSSEELKAIKSENGGLKTLLKNKHEIFELFDNKVRIRYPTKMAINATGNSMTYKKRLCFFYNNHPNGCPLRDEDCSFIHNK